MLHRHRAFAFRSDAENRDAHTAALRKEDGELIGYREKREYRAPERGKRRDLAKSA